MGKCEHQKVSKQSGKRTYASKYLGNCHPNYVGFNTRYFRIQKPKRAITVKHCRGISKNISKT
jgi:hypothetical protein